MSLRRYVPDRRDLEPGGLERPDRGLASRARALDVDLDALETLLHPLARRRVGRHLRRERGRLARAFEARAAGGLPGDHVALGVREADDGVVEACLDVGLAKRDVLAHAPAPPAAAALLLSHLGAHRHFLVTFFLPATCMRRGPLRVRPLVLVRWPCTGRPRRWRRPRYAPMS